jgi:hypothetical protein
VRACAAALLAATAGCEFGERTVISPPRRAVVHAVLSTDFGESAVLVEELLTGRVPVNDSTITNADDPIQTGGGVPISGARVVIADDAGNTAVAVETRVLRGTPPEPGGTGVYKIVNALPLPGSRGNVIRVQNGRRYTLRVETADGRVVTGSTVIPGTLGTTTSRNTSAVGFNVDRDTLQLNWNALPGARSYAVRIDSPLGAFFFFTDSTTFRLTGDLRNLFAERLPTVFLPGLRQTVSVAAVDTNYFDYYRSGSNPFTGSGIINRLEGGIGVFGAYVPLQTRSLQVTGEVDRPLEGRYVAPLRVGRDQLRLWVVHEENGVTQLSGNYRIASEDQFGLSGRIENGRVTFTTFLNQDSRLRFRELTGTIEGDTLTLVVRGALPAGDDGRRRFVKTTLNPQPGSP